MIDLLEETIRLAQETTLTVDQLCREARIRPRWLARFRARGFKDPGVTKVERLNRVLKAHRAAGTARGKAA